MTCLGYKYVVKKARDKYKNQDSSHLRELRKGWWLERAWEFSSLNWRWVGNNTGVIHHYSLYFTESNFMCLLKNKNHFKKVRSPEHRFKGTQIDVIYFDLGQLGPGSMAGIQTLWDIFKALGQN